MFQLNAIPAALYERCNAPLLTGILRGVEKESLRTRSDGHLALTPHPVGLGSALTHPQITTDFSEALLEFITPPSHRVADLLTSLDNIHRFAYAHLDEEILWSHSMPCQVGKDADIPVARYGNSNAGRMKTIYRVGLGHRYGRTMQTVAGVHYNFSLPEAFWAFMHRYEGSALNLEDFRTTRYFDLIRNFRRHYWLLIYLFGASPAVCPSFVQGRPHNLIPFRDGQTLHLPYATSLRMGDLGYQSAAQEALYICYNEQRTYVQTLVKTITTPHPPYAALGVKDEAGNYRQLNTGLLQIENEFYSPVRPKRTARSGETALTALCSRGVEYIEVRCLDLDPYEPLGINRGQMLFLDTFLLYCALQYSPRSDRTEFGQILENQKKVVSRGREPDLALASRQYGTLSLMEWGLALLDALQPVADLLDGAHETDEYSRALDTQRAKVKNPAVTPSARVLADMETHGLSFARFALETSAGHSAGFRERPLDAESLASMQELADLSLREQAAIEDGDSLTFEAYLANYYRQYKNCDCKTPDLTAE